MDIKSDGRLDYSDSLLSRCDVVVASIHMGGQQSEREISGRLIQAMENENVDIIAHPTGRIIGQREPYELDLSAVLEAAARTGTALEINSYPSRLDLGDVNARAAREAGARLAINSDAHETSQLAVMRYGINVARRAWLERKDVLNALSLKELLASFKR